MNDTANCSKWPTNLSSPIPDTKAATNRLPLRYDLECIYSKRRGHGQQQGDARQQTESNIILVITPGERALLRICTTCISETCSAGLRARSSRRGEVPMQRE